MTEPIKNPQKNKLHCFVYTFIPHKEYGRLIIEKKAP